MISQGSAAMKRELDALIRAFNADDPTENVLCAAAFYRLWHGVLLALSGLSEDQVIARAVARIEARPLEPIRLEELYRLCCLSRSGFFKRFRAATGCTPVQYRTRMLARIGRQLMESGEYTRSPVAAMLGLFPAHYPTVPGKTSLPVPPPPGRSRP